VPLASAVPSVARWSGAGLPRGLPPGQVAALLASCDRRQATGKRDYAILVLLARLGLRAAEIAALRLDDIDWRAGEIVVRGKGHTEECLPLPCDVLKRSLTTCAMARPRRPEREVFLRASAPLRGLAPEGVSEVVRAASERAGLGSFGAHRLRHTAGTEMLRPDASLPEVAQACVTAAWPRPPSTPRWTSSRCASSRCRGREDERGERADAGELGQHLDPGVGPGALADLPVEPVDQLLEGVDERQVVAGDVAGHGGQLEAGEPGPAGPGPAPGGPHSPARTYAVDALASVRLACRGLSTASGASLISADDEMMLVCQRRKSTSRIRRIWGLA